MPRGGKRPGAGRKQNPHKSDKPSFGPVQRMPRTYDPEVAIQARKLCELGATTIELADFFGVQGRTINRWAVEFYDFSQALKAGKESADLRVERSLYHRAVGYEFDSVKIFQFQGKPVRVEYREHIPPDTGAAAMWLKARKPSEWRERQETGEEAGTLRILIENAPDADCKD